MRGHIGVILAAILLGGVLGGGAVYLIGRQVNQRVVVDGRTIDYWLKCIESEDADVRGKGIAALPRFGQDAIAPTLARLGRLQTQSAAADVFIGIGAPALPTILQALQSPSETTRGGALKALDGLMVPPALKPQAASAVATMLRDDANAAKAGQYLLRNPPDGTALRIVADVLRDGRPGQQSIAVAVLTGSGPLGDPVVIDTLRWAMADAPSAELRRCVLDHASRMGIPPSALAPAAISRLDRNSGLPTESVHAAMLLRNIGTRAVPALRDAAKLQVNATIRRAVVDHLAALPGAAAREALGQFLEDANDGIAIAAANHLRRNGLQNLVMLSQDTASPNPRMRELAARTMASVIPVMWNELADLLADSDAKVRAAAVKSIRALRIAHEVVPLEMARSSIVLTRIRGLRLLPYIDDPERDKLLEAAINDPDVDIVAAARAALPR